MADGKVVYQIVGDNSQFQKDINESEKIASGGYGKIKSAGKAAFTAIGAATVATTAFVAASVGVGSEFDKSMSQVAATMGTTVDEIDNLREFAIEMGSQTAFSATQAAEALNYMALAGYDAETSMSMMPNVLNLAAAGGIELARASDMVTDASSALGLSIEETTILVDQMAQAASKSNTSVAQLGDAILAVGGTAKSLAGGTTELSTALGIMADNGIKGAEAGTHLRNIMLSLAPKSDAAAMAMDALGFSAYDADGNLRPLNETFLELSTALEDYTDEEKTNLLSNIFNKTDLAAVDALLSAAKYDMDGLTKSLSSCSINWSKYGDALGIAEGSMEDVASSVQAYIAYGTEEEVILERLQMMYGLTAEDAKIALDTVATAIDEQGNRWTELSGYIGDASGAAEQMAETQLDNLAGDITLFKSALEGAQISISDGVTPALRQFVQFGTDAIGTLSTAFQEGGLSGAMDALGTILSDGLALIVQELPSFVEAGMQLLFSLTEGILESLPEVVEAALEIILTLALGIADALPELIPTIVSVVLQIVHTLIDNVDRLVDAAVQIIIALAQGLIEALPTLIAEAPKIIASLVSALIKNGPQLLKAGVDLIVTLVKGIGGMVGDFIKAGGDLILGLKEGIKNKAKDLANSAKEAVKGALDKAKSFLGINSPSKVFMEIGHYVDEGFALGIDRSANIPERSMEEMISGAMGVVAPSMPAAAAVAGGAVTETVSSAGAGQNKVILQVGKTAFGQVVFSGNNQQTSVHGINYVSAR